MGRQLALAIALVLAFLTAAVVARVGLELTRQWFTTETQFVP